MARQLTQLQEAQRKWVWNIVLIKGAIGNLKRLGYLLGFAFDFDSLEKAILDRNNAAFMAAGGKIKRAK